MQRDAREKHMDNIGTLGKQENQISGISKVAHEADATVQSTAQRLRQQRDKITDATQDTRAANQNVALGKALVNSMTRKECCYKFLLYLMIFVLFCVIVSLGILKLAK